MAAVLKPRDRQPFHTGLEQPLTMIPCTEVDARAVLTHVFT